MTRDFRCAGPGSDSAGAELRFEPAGSKAVTICVTSSVLSIGILIQWKISIAKKNV